MKKKRATSYKVLKAGVYQRTAEGTLEPCKVGSSIVIGPQMAAKLLDKGFVSRSAEGKTKDQR